MTDLALAARARRPDDGLPIVKRTVCVVGAHLWIYTSVVPEREARCDCGRWTWADWSWNDE